MQLYHFTHIWHAVRIVGGEGLKAQAEGLTQIEVCRAILHMPTRFRMVWLTTDANLHRQDWMMGEAPKPVRLKVDVQDALNWEKWAEAQHIEPTVKKGLIQCARSSYRNWWVSLHDVAVGNIVAVDVMQPEMRALYEAALGNPVDFFRRNKHLKPQDVAKNYSKNEWKQLKRIAASATF